MIDQDELPIGFTMELAMNSDALIRFSNMDRAQQETVVNGARQINSRQEMRTYVKNLVRQEGPAHEQNRFY